MRVRTAELEASIEEERKSQFRLEEMRGRMERMQKATIVGQLSNLIAHELAQPLAAVQYYLDGMKTLLSRQPVNTAMLEKSRTHQSDRCQSPRLFAQPNPPRQNGVLKDHH